MASKARRGPICKKSRFTSVKKKKRQVQWTHCSLLCFIVVSNKKCRKKASVTALVVRPPFYDGLLRLSSKQFSYCKFLPVLPKRKWSRCNVRKTDESRKKVEMKVLFQHFRKCCLEKIAVIFSHWESRLSCFLSLFPSCPKVCARASKQQHFEGQGT